MHQFPCWGDSQVLSSRGSSSSSPLFLPWQCELILSSLSLAIIRCSSWKPIQKRWTVHQEMVISFVLTTRVNEFYFGAWRFLLLDIRAEVAMSGTCIRMSSRGGGAAGDLVTPLAHCVTQAEWPQSPGGLSVRGEGRKSVLPDRRVQGVDERIDEVTKTSRLRRV